MNPIINGHNYEQFLQDLNSLDISLTEKQLIQFNTYFELLVKWNEVMNLTGITEFEDVCRLHFVDSLASASYLDFEAQTEEGKPLSLIDVGTGAGFPGIPLKIAFPSLQVTLLDSLNKRVNFLNEVINACGLNEKTPDSIIAIHGRAEDAANPSGYEGFHLRESFDFATARAVANLSTLSEYCLPFVKVGGVFLSYKSGDIDEELQTSKHALHLLGGKLSMREKYSLPGTDISRSLIFIDKNESTSKNYPRKAGLPSKKPLH